MNTNRLERINSEIERYRAAQPELETILALYQKVFDIQESASSQEEPAPLISDEDAIAKLAAGEYILKDIPFEPSAEL
ncbi:formate dehydrogenase accessory protein FdhE, partial [Dehalococcoides mccartyi]